MFGRKSRRRLLRENAAMRQALLWYAAEETWRRKGIHQKGAPRKKWQKSPAAYDRGRLALRVITELDNPDFLVFEIALPAIPLADAKLRPIRLEDMPTPVVMTADLQEVVRADPDWQKPQAIPATDTE